MPVNSNSGEVTDLPLDKLSIGTSQVRTDLASGIDDLAASIRAQGLLHPIHVVAQADGNYEILAGQRRFLAYQKLGLPTIKAFVHMPDDVDETDRIAISLTENLVRRDNTAKELIDACTKLYKRYGSIKMVAEEVGLNPKEVSKYVKYDQLVPELKDLVDDGKLDMKIALQAQKAAADDSGEVDGEAAKKFAAELEPMSNVQRGKFVKAVTDDPTASIEEKIERGRKQPVLKQVIVTLEESMHHALQSYAGDEGLNQDEAAVSLIEDGLVRRGFEGE